MKTYILKQQLSSVPYIIFSIVIAFLYYVLLIFLLDAKIFLNIFSLPVGFFAKIMLSFLTVLNSSLNLPLTELLLFLLISLFVGLNIALIRQKIGVLKHKKIKIAFGAGIISLVGAGCAACGISILSVFGIGAAASIVPFKGMSLSVLALIILLITFYYSIASLAAVCDIPATFGKTRKKKRSSR